MRFFCNIFLFQETIWSNIPNLFFWICPIHGLVQTSISYSLTFTIWFWKICVTIFQQLFQTYPHKSHHISNLEVNVNLSLSLTLSPLYLIPNQSEICMSFSFEIIYAESNCLPSDPPLIPCSKCPSGPLWTIVTVS